MMSRAAKLLGSVVCSTSLLGAMAAPADACCFLDCLFGCGRPCGGGGCPPTAYYGPTVGGCSTGSCGTSTYYGPSWFAPSYCGSACSPCGSSCGPCGSSCSSDCGPCAGGSCSSGDGARGQSPSGPPVNEQWRSKENKTYGDPPNGTNPGASDRTKPETGLEGNGTTPEEKAGGNSTGAFKAPVTGDGGDVQQTGGENTGTEQVIPITPGKKKVGPTAPRIPDDNEENGSGRLPTLNLDEKVASRAAPERKRVTLKANVANARLIRVPTYPKSEWTPVDADAKVAKK